MTITETAIMDDNGNQIGTKYRAGYEVENLGADGEPKQDALEPAFVVGETDHEAKRPSEFDELSEEEEDELEIPDWSPLDEL
jgi:hypothetical protein